jgi:hypothetical protein
MKKVTEVTVHYTKDGYTSENTYDELAAALYQSMNTHAEMISRLHDLCDVDWPDGGIPIPVITQIVDKYGE